jgi:ribulose-bisphosphate carboxylase small chain
VAFDSTRGVESLAMSFIVQRPPKEPGFQLHRQEGQNRTIRYAVAGYASKDPEGERYHEG